MWYGKKLNMTQTMCTRNRRQAAGCSSSITFRVYDEPLPNGCTFYPSLVRKKKVTAMKAKVTCSASDFLHTKHIARNDVVSEPITALAAVSSQR